MKSMFLLVSAVLVLLVFSPAVAQIDLGIPDTVAMEVSVAPDAATNQHQVQLDLYVLNDANTLMGLSVGFGWDNPNLVMDSAVAMPLATDNFEQVFLYDSYIDQTNDNKRFLLGGFSFMGGVPPAPERRLWASYFFTLTEWSADDVIHVDTFEYDGGTQFSAVDRTTMQEYVPVWAAGDAPITILDDSLIVNREIWFVTMDGDDETGTGSQDNPFATIEYAIRQCDEGDNVLVGPGTYTGQDNRNILIFDKSITIRSIEGPEVTVVDCEQQERAFGITNPETSETVIEGFTIRNGRGFMGGAIDIQESTPTVRNCIFEGNVGRTGGALGLTLPTSPDQQMLVSDCVFRNNSAVMELSPISGMIGGEGGSIFINQSGDYGFNARLLIENCVFEGNSAEAEGAVINNRSFNRATTLDLIGCTIVGNSTDTSSCITLGRGPDTLSVTNCIFAFNEAGGGVIRCDDLSIVDTGVVHLSCTDIFGNTGGDWAGCIDMFADTNGNLSADPMFCNRESGDFSLFEWSPCLPANNDCGVQMGAFGPGCLLDKSVWYVSVDGDDDIGIGTPEHPFRTIQWAIDQCDEGDTVMVMPGTYVGTGNVDLTFHGINISLMSTDGPEATVIDCESDGRAFDFVTGETHRSLVKGFTMMKGDGGNGGAVWIRNSAPRFADCVFSNNVSMVGGAVNIHDCTEVPNFERCTFSDNVGHILGGALSISNATVFLTDCLIADNTSTYGGGIITDHANTILMNCTLVGNSAPTGSGICLPDLFADSLKLFNCIIANGLKGPAIACSEANIVQASCTDIFGNEGGDWIDCLSDQLGMNDNFSADPLFCDVEAGVYTLQASSPCAPDFSPCGSLVGAMPVGCTIGGASKTHYVAVDGSDETGDGSFENPYASIGHTVAIAMDGDSILVGPGTYDGPSNRNVNFNMKNIMLASLEGADRTIVDFEGYGPGIFIPGYAVSAPEITGFTFKNGRYTAGGAIRCFGSSPVITGCVFTGCSASNGGAIYFNGNEDFVQTSTSVLTPTVRNCTFANNEASSMGGAIYYQYNEVSVIVENCIFYGNTSGYGAPIDVSSSFVGGASVFVACTDIWGNSPGDWVGSIEQYADTLDNFSADPVFCSPFAGDYHLAEWSPCAPAFSPCNELIGALYPGCDVVVDTLIPTDEWINIYCGMGFLDWGILPAGAEICAYDPDGVMCGRGYVRDDHSYGFIPIYRDDKFSEDADEGAVPGDKISFTIDGVPVEGNAEVIWTEKGDSYEVCQFYQLRCLPVLLDNGWNLVSWNVAYEESIANSFIGEMEDCIDIVMSFEQGGLTYDPMLPEFSTLQDVDYFHGYWVRVSCAFLVPNYVDICGREIMKTQVIPLEPGWNLSSYWPQGPLPTEEALGSVIGAVDVATTFEWGAQFWMPDMDGFNTLNEFKPGLGYWTRMSDHMVLRYPGFGHADSVPANDNTQLVTHRLQSVGQAEIATRSWINVYGKDVTLDGEALEAGDKIEFFTEDGILCGRSFYGDGLLKFTSVYGQDEQVEASKAYPKEGEAVRVYVNDARVLPDVTWESEFARVPLGDLITSLDDLVPDRYSLAQNYPNPFNPSTSIKFGLPHSGDVTLAIYNVLGQKVRTLIAGVCEAGQHEVMWDGTDSNGEEVSSGIYLYRLDASDFTDTRKMVLMK